MYIYSSLISFLQEEQGGYIVQSDRSSSFGLFSSLRFLWTMAGPKMMYGKYERPPFPIVVDMPSTGDILSEMRFSDFFMGAALYGGGIIYGYAASRPFALLSQRIFVYHAISHAGLVFALSAMVLLPYRRLTGYWDNGLRWKNPDDKLKKFDNTSHFENSTIFKHFRIRPDQ